MARRRRATSTTPTAPVTTSTEQAFDPRLLSSDEGLDAFNEQLRGSQAYRDYMASIGIDPGRPVRLSDQQRKEMAQWLQSQGITLPKGIEIDPAGNVNQNEGFGKQLKRWGPIAGGAAVTAFGIPGLFQGLLNAPASAAATAGGSSAGSLGGIYTAPSAGVSQGVSSTIGNSMNLGSVLGNVGGGLLDFLKGGGNKSGGFGIDELIKLIVAGGGIKDLFGLGDDDEAEYATFENESRGGRSLDPRDLLAEGLNRSDAAYTDAQARAKTPVRLRSAFVQQPPVFVGGGLPMPIGVTGMDPALKDSRLLSADMGNTDEEDVLRALDMLRG